MSDLANNFGNLVTDGAMGISQSAVNLFVDSYNQSVDEMFGRLHNHKKAGEKVTVSTDDNVKADYNPNRFKRVAFKNRQQVDRFLDDMSAHGIYAVGTDTKLNGQYLVEIPKSIPLANIKNNDNITSNYTYLSEEEKKTAEVSAKEIIGDYTNRTFEVVEQPASPQTEDVTDATGKISAYRMATNRMGGIGKVINTVMDVGGTLESWSGKEQDRKGEANSNDKIWSNKSGTAKVNSGNKHKAIVINNDTVFIDGKEVQGAVKERVLKEHRKRIDTATKIANNQSSKTNGFFHSKKDIATAVSVAEDVLSHTGRQEYIIPEKSFKESLKKPTESETINLGIAGVDVLVRRGSPESTDRLNDAVSDFKKASGDGLREDISEITTFFKQKGSDISTAARNTVIHAENAVTRVQNFVAGENGEHKELKETKDYEVFEAEKLRDDKDFLRETKYGGAYDEIAEMFNTERAVMNVTRDIEISAVDKETLASLGSQKWLSQCDSELVSEVNASFGTNNVGSLTLGDRHELQQLIERNIKTIERRYSIEANKIEKEICKIKSDAKAQNRALTEDEKAAIARLEDRKNNYENAKNEEVNANKELIEKVGLIASEASALTENSMVLRDFEKRFGVKLSGDSKIDREALLEINTKFLNESSAKGYQFIKPSVNTGVKFDTKALQSLTPNQLKELGLNEKMRDTLIKLNEKNNASLLKKATSTGGKIGGFAMKGMYKLDDSGELSAAIADFQKLANGGKYTLQGVKAVRKLGKVRVSDIWKAKRGGVEQANSGLQQMKKDKKGVQKRNATPADYKRNEKYLQKQKKALDKAKRKEKSLRGKMSKSIDKVKKRVSESLLGKAVIGAKKAIMTFVSQALVYLGAAIAIILSFMFIVFVIISLVQALLNFNPTAFISNLLAPDHYSESVAYKLYAYMKEMEDDWVGNEIENFDAIFEDKASLRFGADYEDMQNYVGTTRATRRRDNLWGTADEIRINPFHGAVPWSFSADTTKYITYPEGWNGKYEVGISSNTNAFNKRVNEGDSYDDTDWLGYTSVENGHTSNIKDIISMIDVLYIEGTSDGELTSILAMSPAQVNWEDFCSKVSSFFSWLGKAISNFFSGDPPPSYSDFESETVSYKTVRSYATCLFKLSHQQEITLKVEYYPVDEEWGIVNGYDYLQGEQQSASEHGVCISPKKETFPLFWNSNHVSPYVWNSTNSDYAGIKYPVDVEGLYDVTLDMARDMTDPDSACLKNNMGSDEATLNYIQGKACWTVGGESTSPNIITQYGNSSGGDTSDGWYLSEEEAKNAILNKLNGVWNKYQVQESPYTFPSANYVLATNRDSFIHTHYELYDYPDSEVEYHINSKEWWNGTYDPVQWYWTGYNGHSGGNYALGSDWGHGEIWYIVRYDTSKYGTWSDIENAWKEGYTTTDWLNYNYSTGAIKDWKLTDNYFTAGDGSNGYDKWEKSGDDTWKLHYYDDVEGYTWKEWDGFGESDEIILIRDCGVTKHYETVYGGSSSWGKVNMYNTVITTYNRDCQQHEFKYCGGHICVNSQGIVFSATNEQVVLANVLGENNPLAVDFDMEANGWGGLKGKHIKGENYNDTTMLSAMQTSGCRSPLYDVQGSSSGMDGLNFYFTGEDNWELGFAVENTPFSGDSVPTLNNYHLLKDIYDVDCVIKKGRDVFPIRTSEWRKYEGWGADNISLSLTRLTIDWYDTYGFDIPWEIGSVMNDSSKRVGYSLPLQDIQTIVDALRAKYGASFTEEREQALITTLYWVGRGHYSDKHKDHDFLSKSCSGVEIEVYSPSGFTYPVQYSGCCTASNDVGFINYIYGLYGKVGGNNGNSITGATQTPNSDYSNLKPMDIITHEAGTLEANTESNLSFKTDIWKDYNNYSAVIFVGVLDEDIELEVSGYTLKAGTPLTIDMNKMNGIGNIYFHTKPCSGKDNYCGDVVYYWVQNPDSSVKFKSFD